MLIGLGAPVRIRVTQSMRPLQRELFSFAHRAAGRFSGNPPQNAQEKRITCK
jgi:hypothetical protein